MDKWAILESGLTCTVSLFGGAGITQLLVGHTPIIGLCFLVLAGVAAFGVVVKDSI